MARTQGNVTTVKFGSDGTVIGSSAAPSGVAGYKNMGIYKSSGQLYLESLGKLKGPGGHDVPIRSKIAATGRAFGKALWKAAPFAVALGLVGDVANIWADLGYTVGPDGKIGVSGFDYSNLVDAGYNVATDYPLLPSTVTSCAASAPYPFGIYRQEQSNNGGEYRFNAKVYLGSGSPSVPSGFSLFPPDCASSSNGQYRHYVSPWRPMSFHTDVPVTPVTESEFLEDLASLSHFPDRAPEALRRILESQESRQAFVDEMTGPGLKPTVTFPQTGAPDATTITIGQPKTSTQTKNKPDGTREITTKTEQQTATSEDGKVIYKTTNITNIYNENTDETTTIEEESEEDDEEKCKEGDKTAGCAELDEPTGEIPKRTETLDFDDSNLFGMGQCPADVKVSIGGAERTAIDFSGTVCPMVVTYVRPLVIALATFMALMILIPGARPE